MGVATMERMKATKRIPATGFGAVVALWAVFLAILLIEPARLDELWSWFRDLPVLGQVAGWVLFLPWALAVVIWGASWALWLRILLVLVLALGTMSAFSPKPG